MRRHALLLTVAVSVACSGSKNQPAAPSDTPVTSWVLAGRVTDSVSSQPVPGATVAVHGRPAVTTGADGRWRLEGSGAADAQLSTVITADGFVPRETFVNWEPEGRENISLELIPERDPFAMTFYRYLVRNGLEDPGSLQPVRRWTRGPNFYIHTYNPKTSRALEAHELDLIVKTLRQAVPQLTGGAYYAGVIESGESAREARQNYINIRILHEPNAEYCGRAYVGANPGEIELNYDRCADVCGAANLKLPPTALAHELGHALGFWHVDKGLMNAYMSSECSSVQFSAAERVHARLAYRRPNGNSDPDRDPTTYAASTTANAPRIECGGSRR